MLEYPYTVSPLIFRDRCLHIMGKISVTHILQKKAEKRTLIMGILNVTPDSFSDGGLYSGLDEAVVRAGEMLAEGADIIDIGGESTRPGAQAVSAEEEIARIVPVIAKIRAVYGAGVVISADTNKASAAAAALAAGANMINSLGGFMFDEEMADVIARTKAPIVIYHIKGEPRTMQTGAITYKNVVSDVNDFFRKQMAIGKKHGVKKEQYILDPGIGFGKSVAHNLTLVKNFKAFKKWKTPLLIGVSRKSHLGKVLQEKLGLADMPSPMERVEAGLAEAAVAIMGGATIVRTHDVLATKKFLALLDEVK